MSNSEALLNEEQLEIFALLLFLALSLPAEIIMMMRTMVMMVIMLKTTTRMMVDVIMMTI